MDAPDRGLRDLVREANAVKLDTASVLTLVHAAWKVREHARILGDTAVGAAVLAETGNVYVGCNVEHQFRSHDVHAEVNAMSSMIAGGDTRAVAVAVASARLRFTPCGACMDWIFELGGPTCEILVAKNSESIASRHVAVDLMPFYPR